MVSRNNHTMQMQEIAERQPHFGIRKLTVGVASVLLSTTLWLSGSTSSVHAETTDTSGDGENKATDESDTKTQSIDSNTQVVVEPNSGSEASTSSDAGTSVDNSSADQKVETNSEETTPSKQLETDANSSAVQSTTKEAPKSGSTSQTTIGSAQSVSEGSTQNAGQASQSNANVNNANANSSSNSSTAQENSAAQQAQKAVDQVTDSAANDINVKTDDKASSSVSQGNQTEINTNNDQDLKIGDLTSDIPEAELKADLTKGNQALINQSLTNAEVATGKTVDPTKQLQSKQLQRLMGLAVMPEETGIKTEANNNFTTVNDFSSLESAISDTSISGVNIKGTITANGDLNINRNFTIKGVDKTATLNLGSSKINNNGQLTLDDITINGAVNGAGDVIIKGTVNSNVDSSTPTGNAAEQGFANPTKTVSGAGVGEPGNPGANTNTKLQDANAILINNYSRRKLPNFYAGNLTVDDNATLNINRTVTGDGIVLKDGAVTDGIHAITQTTNDGKLHVGKNGILTINLKNSNLSGDQIKKQSNTASLDNLNAAVRVNTSGSFTSDANAKITMNVGTGRGIVFSSRSMSMDAGASTNYISRGDPGMSGLDGKGNPAMTNWIDKNPGIRNVFRLGANNTFTFVGREAFMLGNRATFHSGENSVVNVHTYGLGNAIDIGTISSSDANDPNADFGLNIDPGSTVSFISDGKNRGGDYNQNNYVALGGGGQINVMKDATLRVILTGRGSSDLNDDINIASYDPNLSPKIYVGNNATLDVQSDATQGNAELIAVPLPASKEVNFILDNVKYVNLQKTAKVGDTIMAPGSDNLNRAMGKNGYQYHRTTYGNLLFMNAGNNNFAHFIAYGDLAAFKWNSGLKDNNWNPNLSSNGLNYDPNETVSQNYARFEQSADQTWKNMYGFDIPYAGFAQANNNGQVWVDPSGSTDGTNVNSEKGVGFTDLIKGFSPYMSQRLVVIGHSLQPVENQRTVHYVVQDVDENGNPVETDPSQMREIANPYVQRAQGDNAQSQLLYKDNATDQLVQVERNTDGTPKLDEHGAVIPVRDADGNYQTDGSSVNWKEVKDASEKGTIIVKGADGHYHFQGYTAPGTITGTDSNGNSVVSLDGDVYQLATDDQLSTIKTNTDEVVKDGKVADSTDFANTTDEFKSGNFYNTYKDGNLYVVYRVVAEKAQVKIVDDDNNGAVLKTETDGGNYKGKINFDGLNTDITDYINQGYRVAGANVDSDTTTTDANLSGNDPTKWTFGTFDNDPQTDQSFTIHLKHNVIPVTPDTPGTDVPKDSSGKPVVDPHELTKTATRTIHYTEEDHHENVLKDPTIQTITYTGTAYVDEVTKKQVNVEKNSQGKAITDKDGHYIIDKTNTNTPTINWTVTGQFNGFDPESPITKDGITWNKDTDKFTTVPEEQAPDVNKIPDDTRTINEDVWVPYKKQPSTPEKQNTTGQVQYIDQDNNNQPIADPDDLSGKIGDPVTDDKKTNKITDLENKGYVLVDDGLADTNNPVYKENPSDNIYKVIFKHGVAPVGPKSPDGKDPNPKNPTEPHTPGTPINPNDPNGPKWPAGSDKVTTEVTRTVKYIDENGNPVKGSPDNTDTEVQTVTFARQGYVDKTTGKWVNVKTDSNGNPIIDANGNYEVDPSTAADTPTWKVTSKDSDFAQLVSKTNVGDLEVKQVLPTDQADGTNVKQITANPDSGNQTVYVIYGPKDKQIGSINIVYHDTTTGENISGHDPATPLSGEAGTDVNTNGYSIDNEVAKLEQQGYERDTTTPIPSGDLSSIPAKYTKGVQTVWINLKHGLTPVDPKHPHDGVDPSEYTKDVKETVHYVGAGDKTPKDNVQTATWTRTLTVDKVTGQIVPKGQYDTDWTPSKKNYDPVSTPKIDGYKADQDQVPQETVTQQDIYKVVTYSPEVKPAPGNQAANLIIYDDTAKSILNTLAAQGKDGSAIAFQGDRGAVDSYLRNGYVFEKALTGDENNPGTSIGTISGDNYNITYGNYDNNDATTQSFTIYLIHGQKPATPDNPNGVDPSELTQKGTATVHYVIDGNDPDKPLAPSDNVQTITWTRHLTVDSVTGKQVPGGQYDTDWKPSSPNYDVVNTPRVPGYYADKGSVTFTTPQRGDKLEQVVTYKPNGKIIPYVPDDPKNPDPTKGTPIPGVDNPKFPTDPKDPTKTTDGKVPTVPSDYNPSNPNEKPGDPIKPDPNNPGKDIYVPFTPKTPTAVDDQDATLTVIDQTTNSTLKTYNDLDQKHGTNISFEGSQTDITNWLNSGYELVSTDKGTTTDANLDGNDPSKWTFGTFDNDNGTVQRFVVTLKHKTTTFDPDKPNPIDPKNPDQPKPGDKINPNDPDPNGPKVTDNMLDYEKQVTSTVHYIVSDGKTKAPDDNIQKATWKRTITVDNVTGNIISSTPWTTSDKYKDVTTPGLDGYYADKGVVKAPEVTQSDAYTQVTYYPNGKIIPYVPDPKNPDDPTKGTPIPGVDNPKFPTDPNDPTKTTDGKIPTVPSDYNPSNPNEKPGDPIKPDPNDPGKDVYVPFTPKTPTPTPETETVTVKYYDDTDPTNDLSSYNKTISGKAGSDLNYTTQPSITDLENKGYKLISDSFTAANLGGKMPTNGGNYEVHVAHKTDTVTPDKPGKPGEPVDPNNPDGPKYPDGTDINNLQKKGTMTVNYVIDGNDPDKPQAPETQTRNITFNKQITFDEVTGKIINDSGWNVDEQTYPMVNSPVVTGYTPSKKAVGGKTVKVTDTNMDITYTVHYTKNGSPVDNTQHANVIYEDVNDPNKVVVLHTDNSSNVAGLSGQPGDKIVYSTSDEINKLINQGYVLKNDGFPTDAAFDNDNTTDQTFYVTFTHGTKTITPDKPGNPGDPINPNNPNGPKWPDGTDAKSLTKTGTQTVHYVYEDGTKAADDSVTNVQFDHSITYDVVTGEVKSDNGWTPSSQKFDTIDSPAIKGYTPDKDHVGGETVTIDPKTGEGNIDKTYTVTYKKDEVPPTPVADKGSITVNVHDTTDNVDLPTYGKSSGTHDVGTGFTYDKDTTIKDLTNAGYKVLNPDVTIPTEITKGDQKVTIYVEHTTTTVTPDKPGKPGDPIDPNNPDGPKYPDGTDEQAVKRTGTQIIHYVGAGDKTPEDKKSSFDFTRNITFDNVTGKIISTTPWNESSHTFGTVETPPIDGYHADKRSAGGTTVTPDDLNKEVTVTYSPNGKIIPVDPKGNPIPNAPTPQYPTDHDDPTKVTPDEPVPDIPGMTPEKPTVTPTDPGKDTPVIYNPEVKNGTVEVIFHDDTTNTTIPDVGYNSGSQKDGTKVDYTTDKDISNLENKGYEYVKTDGTIPAEITGDKNITVTVHMKHGTVPVTPDKPGKPGEPINPNDPDGPKWPDDTDAKNLNKDVTRTINYVDGDGNQVSDPVTQTVHFTANGVLDKVTGQWTTPLTWSSDQDVKEVNSPVVDGYHLVSISRDQDGNNVKGVTLHHDDRNYVVTVTYAKNGKIIPVDPSGKPIPDAPTPEYPTDPNDPSKVKSDEPVPEIPNMTPEKPTVTPTDPGKDTPVIYNPTTPAKDQNAVVNYVDADDDNKQIATSGPLTGKAGDKIDYSTATTISDLENKGYVLVKDGFPADATYDDDDSTTQTYTVVFKHGTTPVTPDKPGKPGEPINPNDPDGPKWPDDTDAKNLTKDVTRTIKFVDENGNQIYAPVDQTVHFTANGVIDNVTGKWVTPLTWSSDQTVGGGSVPAIDGYHVVNIDRDGNGLTGIKSETLSHNDSDYTVTVTYAKNGRIIPDTPDTPTPTPEPQPTQAPGQKTTPATPTPQPTKPTEPTQPSKPTEPEEPEEPDEPDEPDVPETPRKPHEHKRHENPAPVRPSRRTPAPRPQNNYWSNNVSPHGQGIGGGYNGGYNNNVAPHGQSVNGWDGNIGPNGEHVDSNGNIVAPNGQIIGYVDKNGNPHYTTLPQTGEDKTDETAAVLGGLAASIGLIGLAGSKKRRKDEE